MSNHEIVLYGGGKGKGKSAIDDPQQKKFVRRTVDYGSTVVKWLEGCLGKVAAHRLQPHYSYSKELMPPFATPQSPYDSICCRFVHSSASKNRSPVNVVHWFPNGRRLISGTQTGEITIWNGFQFHFENILQAHNSAVRAMEWTPEETVLVTGDQLGIIKFWDQFLYNFNTLPAHKESICDISIAPTGLKFCSCADDSHAKVWDLRTGEEERAFTGHGWDVKCCSWHPTKGLVATGSKDSQIKLWDPRASEAITTIFCHKNTVTRVKWSPSGSWLASGSRDQLVMLMDIRMMCVRKVFKAHQKEVTALSWHPENDLLASGGYDSAMHFWDTGSTKPIESLPNAHDGPIWSLAWHPLGHLLVSGSHDYSTRFWSRARPGDSSFTDLLPKKMPTTASDLLAIPVPPPPGAVGAILETGIFAGPSPPADAEHVRKRDATTVGQMLGTKTLRTESGLSLGEGSSRKDVFDTSDFDALDQPPMALPAVSPPVMSPPVMSPPSGVPPGMSPPSTTPPVMSPPAVAPPITPPVMTPPATAPPAMVATTASPTGGNETSKVDGASHTPAPDADLGPSKASEASCPHFEQEGDDGRSQAGEVSPAPLAHEADNGTGKSIGGGSLVPHPEASLEGASGVTPRTDASEGRSSDVEDSHGWDARVSVKHVLEEADEPLAKRVCHDAERLQVDASEVASELAGVTSPEPEENTCVDSTREEK